ncbi:MAG: exodeoxyribonuclease VII small subunit [Pontixanthobacter sp.]
MNEPATDISKLSFEQALSALEDVVKQLESGDVPLDNSITLYERGEVLRKHCQARLDAAQARIEKIVADGDGRATGTVPFDSKT